MPSHFIETLDDPLLYERVESFGGGMDGFQRATLLNPDASQFLQNVNILDNLEARTRAGADTLGGGAPGGANAIQGLIYFDTPTYEQLIAGSNAKLWKYDGSTWAELAGFALTSNAAQLAMAQGIDKLAISDGVNNWRSWSGAAFVDLGSTAGTNTSDPPVGATIMCWHTGRMFASGVATADDTIYASFLLDFVAGKWDHVQFKFRVGAGEGDAIRALAPMQDFNLCVLKENSVYIVNADPDETTAANWPIQRISRGHGIVGKRAWASYGNDVLYFARDGVRSVRRMASAAGQYEVAPPISRPMQNYIDRINWTVASTIAAHTYKHLIFFAVPLDTSTTPSHVLVYNARLNCWQGVWTGWTVRQFETTRFAGVERLVLGEQTGLVRRWKDVDDAADDDTYTEDSAAIATKIWPRAWLFGQPINDKDGYHAEMRFSVSNAIVSVTAVGDGADLRSWQHDLRQSGVTLPVSLPFDLANPRAVTGKRGLRGLPPFNELYLKIETTSGWFALRNVTVSAFLNMLQNE